ncbi:TraB/GumN family protein [Aeromonas bivalvium]|uniref:TraB/GumN family protein n=1 Tax=Aeromonas bivalvium TaxID=440079 RepID=UPI0038CF878B
MSAFRLLLPLLLWLLLPTRLLAEPAFYHLSKGDRQFWLLGSIHAAQASIYPLPDAIERAWAQSRALVLEVNMAAIPVDEWQQVASLTRLPPGRTLANEIPPALYRRTQEAASRLGLPPASLDGLQPWFAAISLTQRALVKSPFSGEYGIDQHFANRAAQGGKPVQGLETLTEQLGYLASVAEHQDLMLAATLDELPELDTSFAAILAAWQDGDEARLIALLKEEMAPPALQQWLEQTLLARRNHDWLRRLPALPAESFVVVGALHLYGEQGLLALLEGAGWRIEPLTRPESVRAVTGSASD